MTGSQVGNKVSGRVVKGKQMRIRSHWKRKSNARSGYTKFRCYLSQLSQRLDQLDPRLPPTTDRILIQIIPRRNKRSRILQDLDTNPRVNYSDNWIVDIKWAAIGTGTRSQTLSFIHRRRHDPQHTRHGTLARPMRPRKVKQIRWTRPSESAYFYFHLPLSFLSFHLAVDSRPARRVEILAATEEQRRGRAAPIDFQFREGSARQRPRAHLFCSCVAGRGWRRR